MAVDTRDLESSPTQKGGGNGKGGKKTPVFQTRDARKGGRRGGRR